MSRLRNAVLVVMTSTLWSRYFSMVETVEIRILNMSSVYDSTLLGSFVNFITLLLRHNVNTNSVVVIGGALTLARYLDVYKARLGAHPHGLVQVDHHRDSEAVGHAARSNAPDHDGPYLKTDRLCVNLNSVKAQAASLVSLNSEQLRGRSHGA